MTLDQATDKGVIEIKIELMRKQKLNYVLGAHIYENYVKHFVENKEEGQKIRIMFFCAGEGKIPFGFITGITDGFNKDSVRLEDMEFKVNTMSILGRDGIIRNVEGKY